jgi:predicted NACHT family NTPase
MSLHIARRIIVDQGLSTERRLDQAAIAGLPTPLIILGEPGLGKSTLCEDIGTGADHALISATRFLLVPDAVATLGNKTLIIDGLDEVTSNTPGAAVDAVVKRLSDLGWSKFILSCRAIDWRGAVDGYKLRQAYGHQPTVLHLEPLRLDEAVQLLAAWQPTIDAKAILESLDDKGLAEIYGNPLSLRLLGEAVKNGALPDTRAGILRDASVALLREVNDAHKGSSAALASPDQLLEGAGAICAMLLLA